MACPGRCHPQFRDKNRRDIGKSQSMWTDSKMKMETPGAPPPPRRRWPWRWRRPCWPAPPLRARSWPWLRRSIGGCAGGGGEGGGHRAPPPAQHQPCPHGRSRVALAHSSAAPCPRLAGAGEGLPHPPHAVAHAARGADRERGPARQPERPRRHTELLALGRRTTPAAA
eukprot:COSAG01_NODE_1152_length_11492_cov_12.314842_11_plen_169_part_00